MRKYQTIRHTHCQAWQITGSGGGDSGAGGGGDNNLTPFLTPQHLAGSPPQSYFSVNSQDSLDVYHDACSTMQRPHPARTPTPLHAYAQQRKRHVSVGGNSLAGATGGLLDLNPITRPLTNGFSEGGSCNGVDDGSDNTTTTTTTTNRVPSDQPLHPSNPRHPLHNTPYPIGHLSLSTNSSQTKTDLESSSTKKTDLPPISSPQKTGSRSAWVQNYRPCVEMSQVCGNQERTVPDHAPQQSKYEPISNNNNNDVWKKNYVACVEARYAPTCPPCPPTPSNSNQPPPPNSVVHMYTFGPPVQQQRVGLQQVREEFKRENLHLNHKVPHLFVISQWQQHNRMSCVYLGYRLFCALYFTMWAVWAWVGSMGYDAPTSQKFHFLLYLTNWSIWTLALDTTLQAINVVLHFKKVSDDGEVLYPSMTRLMKMSWVFSNIMGAIHLFITLSYWIIVFPNRSDERLSEIGINTHIMPGMYVLVDTAVAATPRRLLHAYQPSLFITAYTLFNLIYYVCGGLDYLGRSALYPILDWTRPGITLGIMGTVVVLLVPILHAFVCLLYAARVKLWRILKISRYVREDDEMDQVNGGSQEQVV